MHTHPKLTAAPLRPEDVLPEHVDRAEINGLSVRKGTVAAFLQNAIRWSDPHTPDTEREALGHEIAGSVPALRALGVFAVLEARDEHLRAFLASC